MAELPHEPGHVGDEPARPGAARPEDWLGADETEVEAAFGADVWDGPQGDIADDLVALGEVEQQGLSRYLIMDLVTVRDLRTMLDDALSRGDDGAITHCLAMLSVKDPEGYRRALSAEPLAGNAADDDPEDDPTRTEPLPSTEAKGPEPRW